MLKEKVAMATTARLGFTLDPLGDVFKFLRLKLLGQFK